MKKYCLKMKIKEKHIDDYIKLHKNPWPEIVEKGKAWGAKELVVFMDGNEAIIYFEIDDIEEYYKKGDLSEIGKKWSEMVSPWVDEPFSLEEKDGIIGIPKIYDLSELYERQIKQDKNK